jgi:hypothetical protein
MPGFAWPCLGLAAALLAGCADFELASAPLVEEGETIDARLMGQAPTYGPGGGISTLRVYCVSGHVFAIADTFYGFGQGESGPGMGLLQVYENQNGAAVPKSCTP